MRDVVGAYHFSLPRCQCQRAIRPLEFSAQVWLRIHSVSDLQAAAPNNLRRTAFLACLSPALSWTSLSAEPFGTLFASFSLSLSPALCLTSLFETFGILLAFAGSFSLLAALFFGLVPIARPIGAAPSHAEITCQRQGNNNDIAEPLSPNAFVFA